MNPATQISTAESGTRMGGVFYLKNTTQAYQRNVIARFGNLTMQGLARRENCAMRIAMCQPIAAATPKAVRRSEEKRVSRAEKASATKAQILEFLTHPKTSADLEADTGLSRNSIGAYLRRAAVEGAAVGSAEATP